MIHWNQTADKSGTGRPVDAIICPVAPTLAPKHNETKWWGYTSYWNLADYPAVVFPAHTFSKSSGRGEIERHRLNGHHHHNGTLNELDQTVQDEWDEDVYDGFPVCLQLVGRRLNEEKLLGILGVVETALQ